MSESEIASLRRRLGLPADGGMDAAAVMAIKAFQILHGLTPDGIVGPKTMAALFPASKLTEGDYAEAAEALAVKVCAVKAVTAVESRGSGFLVDGRPVILFERHIMRRRLLASGRDVAALQATMPDVVNSLPGGYEGGPREHGRLVRAKAIDPVCAIESASWGLFQVMGYHWRTLGYQSAGEFERQMGESEGRQLDLFVRFVLENSAIHTALQQCRWADFARLYNGPGFEKNKYDQRLAAAFSKFSEG